MARSRAAATASRARKFARLSVTPALWREGVLSGGQVEAIAANLDADTLELFAEHEAARLDRATLDRLLCDSALHRVLTSGRSTILDYGTTTRTIPAPLFNALLIRDRHCRFPGCDRPAHWCEGHHVRFWENGGPTQLTNLVLLCSTHHHLLHRPSWHAKLLPDATLEVTDPHGRVRSTSPPSGRPPPQLPLE